MKWIQIAAHPVIKLDPGKVSTDTIDASQLGMISANLGPINAGKLVPGPITFSELKGAGISSSISLKPKLEDISVKLALEALAANGILLKNISQSTTYSYDGLEIDLNMTIVVDPTKGKKALNDLNEWFFSKGKW